MKKLMMVAIAVSALSACSSPAERMAKCEAQGVSRDTCYLAEQNRTTTMNAVAEKQALENAANAVQHGQSAKVHDPLREASFTANGIKASVSNGFFTAKINGKQATIKRFNANSYEIKGAGYVLSITLDEDGITDASWNKTHGRDHGLLQFTQK
ncbi:MULTISPECIES: hypothetical protein [Enterobacteriaceae]|jgi:hypothetical protein|uniref:Lipoprotein n=1 Tax=Lelliottia nimipressuralis TaxID=69220 RepID=A0ABD4KBK5_9ENTR|nr:MULTISPECIES: hypothetical protein [Enterobacteriaceae]MDH6631999.1 hypothetical protein [Lelliottia amnigena]PKA31330.1 hypothetical protein CWR41_16100 [Cedecea lapagei]QMM53518.1 hypothetical protein HVX06_13880 [Enterobacter sp. RHB15-C17]AVY98425.1 hypothetical protein DAI21_12545 [Lelliottia sp. WB101]MBF4178227.1 hypothetical protein [Lelliottia nimipressuralis]